MAVLGLFLSLGSQVASPALLNSPGEIVLGMSTVLTGSAENLGRDMQKGILAGLDRANRNGGLNGNKLRLIALDDAYLPARTSSNMRQLIEKDHVLAVIGNVGTPTAVVAVPIANKQKTPFLHRSRADRTCATIHRTATSSISAPVTPRNPWPSSMRISTLLD